MAGETNSDLDVKDVSSLMRIEKASGQLSEVRKDLYPAMLALQERVARECEKADMESMDPLGDSPMRSTQLQSLLR